MLRKTVLIILSLTACLSLKGQTDRLCAGLFSHTDTLSGLQASVLGSSASARMSGLQLSALTSIAKDNRGLQLSPYNYADTLGGVQIGLINTAFRLRKGWQVGLVNFTRDTLRHQAGLVNVGPETETAFMAYVGNTTDYNVALRFRNRHTYSIFGLGFYYAEFDRKFSGSVFYRNGRYWRLSPRWTLSADLGLTHIETFEEKAGGKPQRLFSILGHVAADYRINRHLGAFIATGYGHTRWYGHHRKYRDKPLFEAGLTVNFRPHGDDLSSYSVRQREEIAREDALHPDSLTMFHDRQFAWNAPWRKRHPWRAAAEVAGINVFVQAVDRFVFDFDYSKINPSTFWDNVKTGFVWDNDYFSTNQFAHPYHGNLYFNAARTNGMNFWQSYPYAFCGSLMWEFWGETDPPAINDLISTSFGGTAIGEVLYRSSSLLLDDRTHGMERFWRELGAGILNPVRAFNRILSGDAWRVRHEYARYHDYSRLPVSFYAAVGDRYLADAGAMFRGEHNPFVHLSMEYGDIMNEENGKPYDYFEAEVRFSLSANQPIVNAVHLLGQLWSVPLSTRHDRDIRLGIYQHFDYMASEPVKDGSDETPYKISETAAFGPGLVTRIRPVGHIVRLEQRIFLNAILLGGSKSDYYNVLDRDYNIGSGLGLKTTTFVGLKNYGNFSLHADYYHLWTWDGYEGKDFTDVDPHFYDVQGDHSNTHLLTVHSRTEVNIKRGWGMLVSGSHYHRNTHYHAHPAVKTKTWELSLGTFYRF